MIDAPKLSIIIPVYNEQDAIFDLLNNLAPVAEECEAEVIVIDDGSTDASAQILSQFEKQNKIKLIKHPQNLGYGKAIKTGLNNAKAELVLIIDGDGSYPLNEIPTLAEKASDKKMIVGARKAGIKAEPLVRRIFKWLVIRLLRYLAGYEIKDLNSGMRIFPRSLCQKYISLLPDGFSFTSTLTLIFLSEGWQIEYVEIPYQPRKGRSKFRLREIFPLSLLLLRTIMYFNPLKFFLPLSFALVLIGLFVAFFSIFVLGKFMDVTTAVILIGAVQVFVLGLLADLILRLKK